MLYALYFEIHHLVASAALGFARVAPIFFFLPFLNTETAKRRAEKRHYHPGGIGSMAACIERGAAVFIGGDDPVSSARSGGRRHAGLSAVMAFLGYACAGLYYR